MGNANVRPLTTGSFAMSKRVKAKIKGELLSWARSSAGFDIGAAAAKLGIDAQQLEAWEANTDHPSIPQLRKAAILYKRPLAVFYLPEPPMSFQPMSDFRRLPDVGPNYFSPALTLEIRIAHQRRELALELIEEIDERPKPFKLSATVEMNAETVGASIRSALGISYKLQSGWRDPLTAFRAWRSRIEELGVLVFQASRLESAEASGFAFWAETLPFMVINGKDAYPRRTFSLIHELAHLMLRQSGVSDLDADGQRPRDAELIEVFCNQVAAATLMPRDLFLAETIVESRGPGQHEWPNETIVALAATYGVSREAVVRRLTTFGRASESFYNRKRAQYAREFQLQRQRDREKNEGKPIPRNMPRETLATFGRSFVRMVIENYRSDRLSLSEVSGYLGVKVRHLSEIERSVELA